MSLADVEILVSTIIIFLMGVAILKTILVFWAPLQAWVKSALVCQGCSESKSAVVIVGPSGVGKSTLVDMLRERYPTTFSRVITHTTRAPRKCEQDGVDYHFVSHQEMTEAVANGEFVESSTVHENMYGVSIAAYEAAAEKGAPLMIVDVQGARTMKKAGLDMIFVFIAPPSIAELQVRLTARANDTTEQIRHRLQTAVGELEASQNKMWDKVLINDNVNVCYAQLVNFLRFRCVIQ